MNEADITVLRGTVIQPDAAALLGTVLAPSEALYGEQLGAGAMVGEYRIEELRSRGGFGIVYRAVGPFGRPVAVKVLHSALSESEPVLRRFQQEVEVIRRIRHPGIVQIFSCGDLVDGRPYVVMEWLEGHTLDDVLREGEPLDLAAVLGIAEALCAALSAAHAAGVVHRDIKGSNVMLLAREGGRFGVKLLDFGIAKLMDQEDTKLTHTGHRVGTPSHMAPEQILAQRIGPAADIYSLGVLLFQALTRRLPFSADTTAELEVMHLDQPPPRVGEFAAVPDAVSDVLQRCLAKEPAHRYASTEELIEDLRDAAAATGPQSATFGVQEAQAVGIFVAAAPSGEPDAALEAARSQCEAEGWTTAWAGQRGFLAAVALPSLAEGSSRLRARALQLALRLVRAADGAPGPLSARVHAAQAILLFVQRMPQIVGGELLEMVDAPAGAPGRVRATGAALAGIEGSFEVDLEPASAPGESLVQGVRATG